MSHRFKAIIGAITIAIGGLAVGPATPAAATGQSSSAPTAATANPPHGSPDWCTSGRQQSNVHTKHGVYLGGQETCLMLVGPYGEINAKTFSWSAEAGYFACARVDFLDANGKQLFGTNTTRVYVGWPTTVREDHWTFEGNSNFDWSTYAIRHWRC